MLDFIFDLVFPKFCFGCNKINSYLCSSCQKNIEYVDKQICIYCQKETRSNLTHNLCRKKHGLDGIFILAKYKGVLKKAIKENKYRGIKDVYKELALLILFHYHNKFNFNFLVPVPLSKQRESERGFNQATLLSNNLLINFPKKVQIADILERNRDTVPQSDLSKQERLKNVTNVFKLKNNVINKKIKGQTFCLIDDVTTTGATLLECVKVLKENKAKKVYAMVIAHGN